jgi:CheY-like chemotaxis protein
VGEPRDGYEALAMPQAETRPCVMLLDRMMARLDGMETLRRFIELPGEIQRRVTILLMTARSDPLAPSDAAFTQPVILATVQKPFNLDQLLALAAQASGRLDHGGKIT